MVPAMDSLPVVYILVYYRRARQTLQWISMLSHLVDSLHVLVGHALNDVHAWVLVQLTLVVVRQLLLIRLQHFV